MNKWRIFSVGLAMSLMASQVSYANVPLITPFGTETSAQTSTQPSNEKAEGPGAEQKQNQTVKPSASYTTGSGAVSGEQTTQTTTVANVSEIAVPEVASESAILYDVTHDKVLYEKNADTKRYPASITKLMTAMLVLEHANLNETVTYSETAVTKLESGAVTLQLKAGDQVSVKDSLYGLLLKSANEVANGLAEHVGGSISGFADMMNAKAKALGCTGTHFVNPNGLNDPEHYTTARDMAKIAAAAFKNQTLCEIASTTSYVFPATKAAAARKITMGHKMLFENDARYYNGIVGGKTGYTSLAGNTLVTCVEQDGVRMIAVILKSKSTHYTDTRALLDYGYEVNRVSTTQTGSGSSVSSGNAAEAAGPGASMGPGSAAEAAGPGAVQTSLTTGKWIADGTNWRFELANGTRLSNCFVTVDGVEYAFDVNGIMVTGWLTLGENWHFFGNGGEMIKNDWRKDGEYWFYLGEDGAMLRNTWVNDQYYVGADGVWVETRN